MKGFSSEAESPPATFTWMTTLLAAVRRSYSAFLVSESQVRSIPVPLLGVAGSDDPNLADLQYLRKIRPEMDIVVIKGATHNAPRNARARPEFVEAIRSFIDNHSTKASRK
jgi:pimeloyl-ACP methyl ester carboxylesterase